MNDSLSTLRKFIVAKFSDNELETFCLDYFPEVRNNFVGGMRKDEKVRDLIDYCRRRDRLRDLLVALERERPGQYEKVNSALTLQVELLEQIKAYFLMAIEQLEIAQQKIDFLETEFQNIVAAAKVCDPSRVKRKDALVDRISIYLNVDNNRVVLERALNNLQHHKEELVQLMQHAHDLEPTWIAAKDCLEELIPNIKEYSERLELASPEYISGIGAKELEELLDYLLTGEGGEKPDLKGVRRRADQLGMAHTQRQKEVYLKMIDDVKRTLNKTL